ncbi:MAG: methyltransferase domain-containing protein [Myxococcales bacterium]|nr:methyltransferase domain-containing protein [Myxococcales bacterium]
MTHWQQAKTAAAYQAFCNDYGRYASTSEALVTAALSAVVPSAGRLRCLDWAAGTGVTSVALASELSRRGWASVSEITAFEPSFAMAQHHPAAAHLRHAGVRWHLRTTLAPTHPFDVVVGNSMWWLLSDPAYALRSLAPHLSPDCVLAWSTPAAYCGEAPSPGEVDLAVCLNTSREMVGLPMVPAVAPSIDASSGSDALNGPSADVDTPVWAGPLDPKATLERAGWQVRSQIDFHRDCTAAEWLAHTLLPPVRPPWLRGLPSADEQALVADVQQRISALPAHRQTWRLTVARRRS